MNRSLLDDQDALSAFRARLLAWYRQNKRQTSWRDSGNPYHVWVSEVMLQQTRVDQMAPYFERFIRAFPTLQALAAASEDQVLKVWEGLGYYARARNMHKAAKRMAFELGGRIPDTYQELIELPGIGQYTAAAVSSIAFDRDHPVLDGNVTRVLCRLLRIEEEPTRAHVKAQLIAAGETLLARGEAGDFNQAMMELGSRVCTPQSPSCPTCPVGDWCRAKAELDDPASLPRKVPKKQRPHYQVAAGLIRKGDELLIAQRPAEGMLGGLWEFPGGKQEPGETLPECLVREIREELGIEIEVGARLTSVDHAYSHFSITLHAFAARYVRGTPRSAGLRCLALDCAGSVGRLRSASGRSPDRGIHARARTADGAVWWKASELLAEGKTPRTRTGLARVVHGHGRCDSRGFRGDDRLDYGHLRRVGRDYCRSRSTARECLGAGTLDRGIASRQCPLSGAVAVRRGLGHCLAGQVHNLATGNAPSACMGLFHWIDLSQCARGRAAGCWMGAGAVGADSSRRSGWLRHHYVGAGRDRD